MAWVCWAHLLLRLAPEPETKAASFKQDEVGKMEQIAAIILSELLPCLFTQFSPFRVFDPISLHQHRGAKIHVGKYCRCVRSCSCQCVARLVLGLPDWFWAFEDMFPAKLDLL